MYSKTFAATFVASLMASASAHMFIDLPATIPGSNSKSPLDANGDNFPCQGANLNQGPVTNMAVGSSYPLQFDLGGGANTAVHGGGSCQISVTYETDAAKLKMPSSWKVIHSFVGGCPTNAPGNLDSSIACSGTDGTNCVYQGFTFQIPKELKSGNAVLAWTWFNNIGNREMYMNCARVSISGGSGDPSTLPDMFVANIAQANGCATTERFNTNFPNPGNYVTMDPTLNFPLKAPTGSCGSGSGSVASAGSSSGSGAGTGSGSAAAAVSAPAAAATTAAASKAGAGTFAEGAGSAGSAAAPAAAAATTAAAAASQPQVAASAGSGAAVSGSVPCSSEGFYCISATTFGLCNDGYAIPQPVAAGTQCSGNAIAAVKRHLHIRHMARRSYFGL